MPEEETLSRALTDFTAQKRKRGGCFLFVARSTPCHQCDSTEASRNYAKGNKLGSEGTIIMDDNTQYNYGVKQTLGATESVFNRRDKHYI